MAEQFVTFQSFTDPETAEEMAAIFRENGIPYKLENASSPIDPVIIGSPLDAEIKLKIREEDFIKAGNLLDAYYSKQLDNVPADYYLFDFTDTELNEIVAKPDEWGRFDYLLAQKLLKDRGREISPERAAALKKDRLIEMAIPGEAGRFWIVSGYFIAVFFFIIGVIYSASILHFKKTLPDGRRIYGYREADRKHALNMFVISSVLTAVAAIQALLFAYN